MTSIDRTGLYLMVFITMIASCEAVERLDKIEDNLDKSHMPAISNERQTNIDDPAGVIIQQEFYLPDRCLTEYQYPRSHERTRKCFELLVEEIQENIK